MSTLVSNELFAQPGHRDDVTNLLPALRPGRYSRTPSRTRYRPTSAAPLRSSANQAVRTNLIKASSSEWMVARAEMARVPAAAGWGSLPRAGWASCCVTVVRGGRV
jgi:hypothetical protein